VNGILFAFLFVFFLNKANDMSFFMKNNASFAIPNYNYHIGDQNIDLESFYSKNHSLTYFHIKTINTLKISINQFLTLKNPKKYPFQFWFIFFSNLKSQKYFNNTSLIKRKTMTTKLVFLLWNMGNQLLSSPFHFPMTLSISLLS